MRVFLDTNVVLDCLLKDRVYREASMALMKMGEPNNIWFRIASTSIPTIVYCARKFVPQEVILERIEEINKTCKVLSIGFGEVYTALHSECPDFEDAMQIAAAELESDVIVTGNAKHFKPYTALPVFTPDEFMAKLREHSA